MSANPATELGSAIQSVSIKQDPSPEHDINPSTATSKKELVDLPRPRRKSFPKLPDFRFEQSYLASIKNAKNNTEVALITLRDQVLFPLAQGVLWNMVTFGWRYWNRGSKFSGQSLGAKVRKWWWGFNNWKLPAEATQGNQPRRELAKGAEEAFKAFYIDVLQFRLRQDDGAYVFVNRDDIYIGAAEVSNSDSVGEKEKYRRPEKGVEIVFEVDDLVTERDRIVAAGAKLTADIEKQLWGLEDFRLVDPDGYYNAVNYVSDKVNEATSWASHEANKNVAKDSDASLSTRVSAAKDAVGDKFEEKKSAASAEANKQAATH
ncbi:hypothetical protein DV736_g2862, partial [Chaetothyriales sp. CBS 134916]